MKYLLILSLFFISPLKLSASGNSESMEDIEEIHYISRPSSPTLEQMSQGADNSKPRLKKPSKHHLDSLFYLKLAIWNSVEKNGEEK